MTDSSGNNYGVGDIVKVSTLTGLVVRITKMRESRSLPTEYGVYQGNEVIHRSTFKFGCESFVAGAEWGVEYVRVTS
jgi:hypothetical protein